MPRLWLRGSLAALALMVASAAAEAAPMRGQSMYLSDQSSPYVGWALSQTSDRITAEARRFLHQGNPTGTRGPWCADFVTMILRLTGHRPLANRLASSALAYGPHVARPKPGDIAVMNTRRGVASHVGFVLEDRGGDIVLISGNWSRRVEIGIVPRRQFAAFVRT